MSFLAPLYALGLLAIAGPIIFHLIRRRPKGEVPFSSLLFLTASPPPPARRRRLDQVLLLLLRAAVLALLGIAFMRPFLRTDAAADTGGPGQTVVVLIDTSASMKRSDLWKRAQAEADAALAECRPADRVAVYAFDRTARPVLGLAESDTLDPAVRTAVARDRVAGLSPTWGGTELGQALLDGVATILESDSKGRASGKVVLVSDVQLGAKLTGLAGFEWPPEIGLELRRVTDQSGNAGIDWLTDRGEEDPKGEAGQLRVRLTNDSDSGREKFRLAWDKTSGADVDAYVPPGESRVVKVPRPPAGPPPTLRLHGDAHGFDNTLYLATLPREELSVVFLGPD
ncbi:MAG TPA: BatA domain-containing protein, partial [Gemmataceae bacterium]|nr:BatA domain-containing protein [Gemmataceae bacterium]